MEGGLFVEVRMDAFWMEGSGEVVLFWVEGLEWEWRRGRPLLMVDTSQLMLVICTVVSIPRQDQSHVVILV